ncbi:hypothetical protein Nepgr_006083 [Nepenthes gracilis]|uniref:Uncharacterized protein n=1 Tax=Nepenthes gracilis TaxID=150966 RepID=A0AAD3XH02_NEPGR|nr:hypothetical protein Nepgr_006083 [Nepenthes gracilis]
MKAQNIPSPIQEHRPHYKVRPISVNNLRDVADAAARELSTLINAMTAKKSKPTGRSRHRDMRRYSQLSDQSKVIKRTKRASDVQRQSTRHHK